MVARLTDVISYLYRQYPNRRELSKARLLGMLYLVDWKYALEHDSQLTGIEWSIDNNFHHIQMLIPLNLLKTIFKIL